MADDNGVYRWTWAPEDKVRFNYSKEGYMLVFTDAYSPRNSPWLVAGEKPYEIVMYPKIITLGTVVDDETDKPVTEFKTVPGYIRRADGQPNHLSWQTGHGDTFKDGRFEQSFDIRFEINQGHRLRIDADGYESFISDEIKLGETKRQFDVRLKKIDGLSGTVLLPDGSPAVGTKIYVTEEGRYLQITNPPDSELLRGRTDHLTTIADNDGKFTLSRKSDDNFGIYLEHPQGICYVKRDEFLNNREVRLRGFAKLEVVIPKKYSDEPEAHITLWAGGGDGLGHVDYYKELKSGVTHYTFNQIVAGNNSLDIWAKSPDHVWVNGSTSREAICVPFEIEEGETKTIDLTVAGTTVTGKITLPSSVKESFAKRDWSYNHVTLGTRNAQGGFQQKYGTFMAPSPNETQTGVFRFERVPPGEYFTFLQICKAPEDTTTMDTRGTQYFNYQGTVSIAENQKTAEIQLSRYVFMAKDDVIVFGNGKWKDEKTGEEFPAGTTVAGGRIAFQLNVNGEVERRSGDGTVERVKAVSIRLSNDGNAILD